MNEYNIFYLRICYLVIYLFSSYKQKFRVRGESFGIIGISTDINYVAG